MVSVLFLPHYTKFKADFLFYFLFFHRTHVNIIKKNEIPKVYINASFAFQTKEEFVEYIEYSNAKLVAQGKEEYFNLSDDAKTTQVAQKYIDSCTSIREGNVMPYIESLGNCQYVGIAGDHLIYEQKPDEVAKAIEDFLKTLK